MQVQNIFYGIGALFVIVSVLYFSFEFLQNLPQTIKFVLLLVSVIITFFVAELLRGSDY
jgi:hypothetical protein